MEYVMIHRTWTVCRKVHAHRERIPGRMYIWQSCFLPDLHHRGISVLARYYYRLIQRIVNRPLSISHFIGDLNSVAIVIILIIDLFTRTLTLILFGLVAWQMFLYAADIHETGEVSMNLEFPIYYIVYILAFGLLIFSVSILETLFNTMKQLREANPKWVRQSLA